MSDGYPRYWICRRNGWAQLLLAALSTMSYAHDAFGQSGFTATGSMAAARAPPGLFSQAANSSLLATVAPTF